MSDQLDLFPGESDAPDSGGHDQLLTSQLRLRAGQLSSRGVYIGTSSWKYPGWCGLIYRENQYQWRGRFNESRFNRDCLAEYAEVFRSVCVDAAYYQYPSHSYLTGLAAQVPRNFRFSFKVSNEITLKRFPHVRRMGTRAGQANPHFLDAERFRRRFLDPLETIRAQTGLIMFEFSRFSSDDFRHPHEFLERLDGFLGALPRGWDYAVEIRNEEYLEPAYLKVLHQNGVGHVFNSWEAMPEVEQQLEQVGDQLGSIPLGARFLLRPGCRYQDAVNRFTPYRRIGEVYPGARAAGARLIVEALKQGRRLYLYGNNRLEGCSPITLAEMLKRIPPEIWQDIPDTEAPQRAPGQ